MSMLATFVQVEPGFLERLEADPSIAEGLFMPDLPAIFDPERMREAVLARGPQLLAGAIDQHPELREQIERSLGRTQKALRGGAGGAALLALMQQRLGGQRAGKAEGAHTVLSLDKAWHGVHFVLCGEVEPGDSLLSRAVLGGTEIGDDFSGYGPARYFTPAQVAEVARALVDPEVEQDASGRYDPERMTRFGIYPFGWDEQDNRGWIFAALRELRDFYAEAADQGRAVVTCLV